ncbi:MAG: hypothetical protein MUQ10_18470 [Anaerolineae bacterium]|nr:hypothetical protein [Anaerolineae bacterium]
MSKAAKSLYVFAIYLVVIGLGFMAMPNLVLPLFGFAETSEPWIRVMAMLLILLAYYYFHASRNELTDFIRITVYARASVTLFFAAFVLLDLAQPMLLLFAAVDLLAAVWTWVSLRQPQSTPSV